MPPNDEPPLSLSARIMKLQGHTVYVDRWTGLEEAIAAGSGYGHVYISGDSLPPTPFEPYRPVCGMSQDANSSPPAADWIRTADGRCFRWEEYPQPVARYAGHDVTDQPRDDHGRWANAGGAGNGNQFEIPIRSTAQPCKATTTRPNESAAVTDSDGNIVGNFNFSTGWVTRSIQIGHSRTEKAVAPVDDVVKWLNRANGPVSATEWNAWFIRNGHPAWSAPFTAPNYEARRNQVDEERIIVQGEMRVNSGFDSDGRPREYAASMAGPLVVKLVWDVASGLLEKYGGGQVVGLAVNAGGKLVVGIARRGKETVVELSDNVANKLRQRINREATDGLHDARQLKKWLDNNAPKPGWKSSIRSTTGDNSKLLRNNLGDTIKPGQDPHHIVQSTSKHADAARKLLDKYQIVINDAVNGVPLNSTGAKPAHHGHLLHSPKVIDRVNDRLKATVGNVDDWPTGRAELLKELRKLKGEIARGEFP